MATESLLHLGKSASFRHICWSAGDGVHVCVRRSGLQLQPLHPALGEALRDHPQQDSNNIGWWSNTLLHRVLRTTLKYLFCEIKLKPSVAIFFSSDRDLLWDTGIYPGKNVHR
jgi:hypothetical protein